MRAASFKKIVWNHYQNHGRALPWRETRNPYHILVSEVMLQQTQVSRVIPKYASFLERFPDSNTLASASLRDVLSEWQGLGYNRRARSLQRAAQEIVEKHNGIFPHSEKDLLALSGVGPYTAGAIRVFAWNKPAVIIETNIRSVFLHHFFNDASCKEIADMDIMPLVEKTLDAERPREWYWALMDYGATLKKAGNPNTKSAHYARQSPFKGSWREKRSGVLKALLESKESTRSLSKKLSLEKDAVEKLLEELHREGMVAKNQKYWLIS